MTEKERILNMLKDEYERWNTLLGRLPEEQITSRQLAGGWSIKDVMAHLMAWQQRSIARMEAGLSDHEPVFPAWPEGVDPEQEDVDEINAWIYETHRERSWEHVYQDWRNGFQRFIELGEAVPEGVLMEVGRFAWLKEYPLSIILVSSYEHHQEHRDNLVEWLRQNNHW
jgi:hypothetical protein